MTNDPILYHDGDIALQGEVYRPARPNGAAILVVHEADGIGGNVRRRCRLLAERGYMALAADLHGGGRVLDGDAIMRAVAAFREDPPAFRRRVGAGLRALSGLDGVDPARIGAIGYCFGGMAVLELARAGAPIAAAISFHGLLTTQAPAARGAVTAGIAVFTGALDPLVPPQDVAAFQAEMTAAEVDWQLTVYGQAWHSFTNAGVADLDDPRMRYDPRADSLSWAAALDYLTDRLSG